MAFPRKWFFPENGFSLGVLAHLISWWPIKLTPVSTNHSSPTHHNDETNQVQQAKKWRDLNFDSHALAEVVIDNPEEVVENQIILEPMDIGDAIFDIFL